MIIECSVQKVIRFNVKETLAYCTLLFSLTWTQSLLQYIYVKSISDGLVEVSERVKIKILDLLFFTTRQRSCGELMFSQMSVCHSVQGGPMWQLPMIHWTSLYTLLQTWDLTPQGLPLQWHLVAITEDLFKLVHFRTSPPHQYWHLVTIEACTFGASGR